jgi:hypothetical protein
MLDAILATPPQPGTASENSALIVALNQLLAKLANSSLVGYSGSLDAAIGALEAAERRCAQLDSDLMGRNLLLQSGAQRNCKLVDDLRIVAQLAAELEAGAVSQASKIDELESTLDDEETAHQESLKLWKEAKARIAQLQQKPAVVREAIAQVGRALYVYATGRDWDFAWSADKQRYCDFAEAAITAYEAARAK